MTIYCNVTVSQETLATGDWVVSSNNEEIKRGTEAGCNTIYLGEKTCAVSPSLFAPTVEDAMLFIKAYEEVI